MKSILTLVLLISSFLYAGSNNKVILITKHISNDYSNTDIEKLAVLNKITKENSILTYDIELVNFSSYYNNMLPDTEFKRTTFIALRQLSLEYKFHDTYCLTMGILPFNYGELSDYLDLETSKGNGILNTTSINVNGLFLGHETSDNNKLIVGWGSKDKLIKSEYTLDKSIIRTDNAEYKLNGTSGYFMIDKYKKDNNFLETDLFKINIKINGTHYTDIYLLNLGYIYKNLINYNNTYFTVLSLSKPSSISNPNIVKDRLGKSITIGTAHFYTIRKYDNTVTVMFRYTYDNYINASFGEPFSTDGYSDIGPSITIVNKFLIKPTLTFLLGYKHLFNDTTLKSQTLNYYMDSDKKIKDFFYAGLKFEF